MTIRPTTTRLTSKNKLMRGLWQFVWVLLYRPSPRNLHAFRRGLLRLFGATIGNGAHPYPGARIYAPWNLQMDADSCLSDHVDCYCVDRVTLEAGALVSQYSFLCTATHDYRDSAFPTQSAPIVIKRNAWIAADCYIGPGVSIGENAIVAVRSLVIKDVPANQIVGGHPAEFIRQRDDLHD